MTNKPKHISDDIPLYEKNAKAMRKNLKIAIVVLVILIAGLCGTFYFLTVNSNNVATQQDHTQAADVNNLEGGENTDTSNMKSVSVPDLNSYIGKNIDEVTSQIGHGAQVSSDTSLDDENNPIKRAVKLTLSSDSGDSKSGTPTVVLNVGEDSNVLSLEYSASTKALGFGAVSFRDALNNEHIIESVLRESGVNVSDGAASLGDDVAISDYTTYASDGIKTTKEERSFEGETDGAKWSARLTYDYTIGNATDNLSDTVRTIWIGISH